MTDKQIIIDGVDCRYWFRPNPTDYRKCSLRGQDDNCDEIKDCFVKELLGKLAHKEQECEELKEKVKKYGEINKQETKDYAELKAENDLFRTCHDNEQAKRRKYGQAIEDIKEIAKKTLNMVDYKTYFKRDNKSLKQEGFKALNEILQKISEVEK